MHHSKRGKSLALDTNTAQLFLSQVLPVLQGGGWSHQQPQEHNWDS
jgi:hypothetical protein